jgi:hypothetical protein
MVLKATSTQCHQRSDQVVLEKLKLEKALLPMRKPAQPCNLMDDRVDSKEI